MLIILFTGLGLVKILIVDKRSQIKKLFKRKVYNLE